MNDRNDSEEQSSSTDALDKALNYLNELYVDDDSKEVLSALFELSEDANVRLRKKDIAEETSLETGTIHAKDIFEKLQAVAIIELITKVRGAANNEEYVLPRHEVCGVLQSTDNQRGVREVDFEDEEEARALLERFGQRLCALESSDGDAEVSTPRELYLEYHLENKSAAGSIESMDDIEVSVSVNVQSRDVSSSKRKYSLTVGGSVTGIVGGRTREICSWLSQEIVQRVKAATYDTEVNCTCDSLEEHLQKAEPEGNGCTVSEDTHYVEHTEEDKIEFETELNNLEYTG